MVYVISDIHGCYEKYKQMIEKIKLSEDDTLYVLGDSADRGNEGIDVWIDLMRHTNVVPVIGNHDAMALGFMKVWLNPDLMTDSLQDDLAIWIYNGGRPTLESFYLYKEIVVNGQKYFLSHSIGAHPNKSLKDYTKDEYIWGRPDYSKCYDENIILITGHTPTGLIDRDYLGRIYKKNNHIAVDCGAVFDVGKLGCICLDTMEEFYV